MIKFNRIWRSFKIRNNSKSKIKFIERCTAVKIQNTRAYHLDELTGVVIDIGNMSCRAGYSGEDTPKNLFPSVIGVQPQDKIGEMDLESLPSDKKGQGVIYHIGEFQVKTRRDYTEIHETFKKSTVLDFNYYERLISEIYQTNMGIGTTQYPLLLTEPSIHKSEQRQKICEIMCEKFSVPALFMCKQAVLSCFASGRGSALILDSGATQTLAVPVHDGYALQRNISRVDFGGEFLTEQVLSHVEENMKIPLVSRQFLNIKVEGEQKFAEQINFPNTHPSFVRFTKMELARDLKESTCRFADVKYENPNANDKVEYELPDGKKLSIEDIRFSIGDIFFNAPEGEQTRGVDFSNYKGMHNMIIESINKCDVDLRKELLSNIILTGGNSLFPGLPETMQKKLIDIAPQNAKVKLIAYPHSIERRYSSWVGGSILSSLGSFQSMWISKAEYDEYGKYIVEKKCP